MIDWLSMAQKLAAVFFPTQGYAEYFGDKTPLSYFADSCGIAQWRTFFRRLKDLSEVANCRPDAWFVTGKPPKTAA